MPLYVLHGFGAFKILSFAQLCPQRQGALHCLFQIVHLDAYCNECGNCETFCPYSGGPYKKKFTLFSSEKDFLDSTNDGFFTEGDTVTVRLGGEVKKGVINSERELEIDIDEDILCLISEIFISYPYLLNRVDAD